MSPLQTTSLEYQRQIDSLESQNQRHSDEIAGNEKAIAELKEAKAQIDDLLPAGALPETKTDE